jgi:hypothetical protein
MVYAGDAPHQGGVAPGLYQARSGNWWTAVLKTQIHHFCCIKVYGTKSMILKAVALNGQVIDAVTLEQCESGKECRQDWKGKIETKPVKT